MVTSKLTYTSQCLNVHCHSLNGEVVQLFRKVGGGGVVLLKTLRSE